MAVAVGPLSPTARWKLSLIAIDAGKVKFAAGASITLTKELQEKVYGNLENYADKICLRPQEISNHPELIRRLGLISINTALELDIYGNVNSTHVQVQK